MVLLLIIFSGLLVIRCRGGGTFGLTRLLWKQVRYSPAAVLLARLFFLSGGHLARTWLHH